MKIPFQILTASVAVGLAPASNFAADASPLQKQLSSEPFQIVHESYVNGNWDLVVMEADGANPRNITNTPDVNEIYPQVSPNGTMLSFVVDAGEGRETVRSVYVSDIDGGHRRKIADHARQPFWHPNGDIIAYLPQEYPKWNVVDFYTKGIVYYDLKKGKSEAHPNAAKLHHLYNPNFSRDGRWIVATVHAGMGFSHAILLIEAYGSKIIDLKIPGCRPCLSPDGKQIAWGPGDHEIAVAPIDLDADEPKVGERRIQILDKEQKIYHVDWSPDSKFLSISRGPDGEGDISQKGTHHAACEIVGVYAPGWDIYVVSAERNGPLDLGNATDADFSRLTSNGLSNKESAWFLKSGNAK